MIQDWIPNLMALVAGISIGLHMADWDHKLPFFDHRSFWTHGMIVPLIVWWLLVSGYNFADPYFEDAKLNAEDWSRLLRFSDWAFFRAMPFICASIFFLKNGKEARSSSRRWVHFLWRDRLFGCYVARLWPIIWPCGLSVHPSKPSF